MQIHSVTAFFQPALAANENRMKDARFQPILPYGIFLYAVKCLVMTDITT